MIYDDFYSCLDKSGIEFETDCITRDLVSLKIGGKAKAGVFPKTKDELLHILNKLRDTKHTVIGNGTNVYFVDSAYDGVIVVTRNMDWLKFENEHMICGCGVSLFDACRYALDASLSGIEFAYGIPGTVGGAICMNASAFGAEISQLVVSSVVYDVARETVREISYEEHDFSPKHSAFKSGGLVLIESKLKLTFGEKRNIYRTMLANISKREKTQPLDYPSAGSIFVRPKGYYASKLIDECGLKGLTYGGAQVSKKHAGFIINLGEATSSDVNFLIDAIKTKVFEKFGVELKEEVIYLE